MFDPIRLAVIQGDEAHLVAELLESAGDQHLLAFSSSDEAWLWVIGDEIVTF